MKEYMEMVSVEEAIKAGRVDTLCWDCQKCTKSGCSWTDPAEQRPVNGWVADETENGYRVVSCPEFVRGTYGGGRYRTADDYILALEIKVTDQAQQIKNLKATLWWKYINRLRCKNRELQIRIKRLGEKLEEMENGGKKNGSEKDNA